MQLRFRQWDHIADSRENRQKMTPQLFAVDIDQKQVREGMCFKLFAFEVYHRTQPEQCRASQLKTFSIKVRENILSNPKPIGVSSMVAERYTVRNLATLEMSTCNEFTLTHRKNDTTNISSP